MCTVDPDVLGTEHLGRLPVVAREYRDVPKIGRLRIRRQVPDPHVVEHPLGEDGSGETPV